MSLPSLTSLCENCGPAPLADARGSACFSFDSAPNGTATVRERSKSVFTQTTPTVKEGGRWNDISATGHSLPRFMITDGAVKPKRLGEGLWKPERYSSTKMNFVSYWVRYLTRFGPGMLFRPALRVTRVCNGIRSGTSM